MSQNRQFIEADESAIAVRSLALGLPCGMMLASHAHPWAQLVYAIRGVVTVTISTTNGGSWVVPAHRAVWIPAGVAHRLEASTEVDLRTVYLRPGFGLELPADCCVVAVTPLMRELILTTLARRMLRDDDPAQWRLAQVLVDQLTLRPALALDLRRPSDARACRVADAVMQDLSGQQSLAALAQVSGASVRTLERLFSTQTGINFGAWRQRARLLQALRLLAAGTSVTATALSVGYDSTSAFVAAFKRTMGTTPGRYFDDSSASRAPD